MLKKTFAVIGTLALALTLASCGAKSDEQLMEEGWVKNPAEHGWVKDPATNGWVEAPKALPENSTTDFSKAASKINAKNLHEYLNRSDVVYIDLRGKKNGYLASHLRGFESIEFFDMIWNRNKPTVEKPEESYNQLFKNDFTPRYEESEKIINSMFPKDKAIFLNCTSGARVVNMMHILDKLGYDMKKVYNVGGSDDFDKEPTLKPLLVKKGFNVTATETYDFSGLKLIK